MAKLRQEAKAKGIIDDSEIVDYCVERYIVGWTGVEAGDTKKPLPFNDQTRAAIFGDITADKKARIKFMMFGAGNLGN